MQFTYIFQRQIERAKAEKNIFQILTLGILVASIDGRDNLTDNKE